MATYNYYINSNLINQYVIDKIDIPIKVDNDFFSFVIESNSVNLRLIDNATTRAYLVSTSYLRIDRDSTTIWGGWIDLLSYTKNDKDNHFGITFLAEITKIKDNNGMDSTYESIQSIVESIVDDSSGYLVDYDSDNTINGSGYLFQICTLRTLQPPDEYTFETLGLYVSRTMNSTVAEAIVVSLDGDYYVMEYRGGMVFGSPIEKTGVWYVVSAETRYVDYYGNVTGADMTDTLTGTLDFFCFVQNGIMYANGEHTTADNFLIGNWEDVPHADLLADICFFADSKVYALGGILKFVRNGTSTYITAKVFEHTRTMVEYNPVYELRAEHSEGYPFVTQDMQSMIEYYRIKYQLSDTEGMFEKHNIVISDENDGLEIGQILTINGEYVGKITEIVYKTGSNTIKLTTVENR